MRPLSHRIASWTLASALVASASSRARSADVPAADYQRLLQRVANQEAAIESFRRTLQDLRVEVVRMRSTTEQLKPLANATRPYATTDQLRQVAEQVRSVERNRVADRQQILLAIEGLKGLATSSAVTSPKPSGSVTRPKSKGTAKGKPSRKAPAPTQKSS